jgi:hypothetical protein
MLERLDSPGDNGSRDPAVFVVMDADTGKIIGPRFPSPGRCLPRLALFRSRRSRSARAGAGSVTWVHSGRIMYGDSKLARLGSYLRSQGPDGA